LQIVAREHEPPARRERRRGQRQLAELHLRGLVDDDQLEGLDRRVEELAQAVHGRARPPPRRR
jgi:hypothetical protein